MRRSQSFLGATAVERSVFISFMLLWIAYGVLNQYNAIHHIEFDPTPLVWLQEILKICLSLILLFVQDGGGPYLLFQEMKLHSSMFLWYLIPASLYALGDVLTYINLRTFDPATLHLLNEMKLVVTAIVHQVLFRRMLNKYHWAALAIVTAGCVFKAVDSIESSQSDEEKEEEENIHDMPSKPSFMNYLLIGVYIAATTIAGVFNEKLLKDKPTVSINFQNICLYFDGIIFLTVGMLCGLSENKIKDALSTSNLLTILQQPSVVAMAVIMACAGIVTSRFLKFFDSIQKSVAVALVVVTLPLLGKYFFATAITIKMVLSILMVVFGMYVYSAQPAPKAAEECIYTSLRYEKSSDEEYDDDDETDSVIEFIPLQEFNK